jgi:calcineurin-like phosphoesterase family protein
MVEACGRPQGYEQKLLKAISLTVHPDDLLINLGDFCWHRDAYWHEQYMCQARCLNWLTIGNHDGKTATWYLSQGWNWAGESCIVKIQGQRIVLSHLPLPDTGDFDCNVHGHFHDYDPSTWLKNEPELVARLTNKHILMSVEHTNYQPIELQTLLRKNKRSIEVK